MDNYFPFPIPDFPAPGKCFSGDGLSGFREIIITDEFDGEHVFFSPTSAGWKEIFLTYQMPVSVFHRVYTPCANHPPESYFSKTVSRYVRPFFFPVTKFFKAARKRIARLL